MLRLFYMVPVFRHEKVTANASLTCSLLSVLLRVELPLQINNTLIIALISLVSISQSPQMKSLLAKPSSLVT